MEWLLNKISTPVKVLRKPNSIEIGETPVQNRAERKRVEPDSSPEPQSRPTSRSVSPELVQKGNQKVALFLESKRGQQLTPSEVKACKDILDANLGGKRYIDQESALHDALKVLNSVNQPPVPVFSFRQIFPILSRAPRVI